MKRNRGSKWEGNIVREAENKQGKEGTEISEVMARRKHGWWGCHNALKRGKQRKEWCKDMEGNE